MHDQHSVLLDSALRRGEGASHTTIQWYKQREMVNLHMFFHERRAISAEHDCELSPAAVGGTNTPPQMISMV